MEEHQAYKPKGPKAKHSDIQVREGGRGSGGGREGGREGVKREVREGVERSREYL